MMLSRLLEYLQRERTLDGHHLKYSRCKYNGYVCKNGLSFIDKTKHITYDMFG